MGDNRDEGKVIGNFRAGITSFLSVIFIACLPLIIDKDKKELLDQLRIVSPIFAGGVAYALSIPFMMFVNSVDVRRYQAQVILPEGEAARLDPVEKADRLDEIKRDISAYNRKLYEINSKSLFT